MLHMGGWGRACCSFGSQLYRLLRTHAPTPYPTPPVCIEPGYSLNDLSCFPKAVSECGDLRGGRIQFQASDPLDPPGPRSWASRVCCWPTTEADWQMREGRRSIVLNSGAFPALVADDLLEQQP